MITVYWGNRLEDLADRLFDSLHAQQARSPAEALARRRCVVIPNRIIRHWLAHHYLYGAGPGAGPRVLADCDWPLLHVFVNDGLFRLDHPGESRDPTAHPFSVEAMRWRLYRLLEDPRTLADEGAALAPHLAPAGAAGSAGDAAPARLRFKLAGRLARLFDEYMVYRPETLTQWEQGRNADLPPELAWEPMLWRRLTEGRLRRETYLDAFRRLARPEGLTPAGIGDSYPQVHVFGVSMMPRVYLWFFQRLSEVVPVALYLLNPSGTDWFCEPPAVRQRLRAEARGIRLEAAEEEAAARAPASPLLATLGKGCREFLAEVLDVTGGQAEAGACLAPPPGDTLLHRLQADIVFNRAPGSAGPGPGAPAAPAPDEGPDPSVQVHACHGLMREAEVLRDHLLKWLSTRPGLQPRDIQVQVSDLAAYAPCLDAVFATQARSAPAAIPYVIADRVLGGGSRAAEAFVQLLQLAEGRLTAPEALALLHVEALAGSFGFAPEDLPGLARWIEASGIRWGYDAGHRLALTGVAFADFATWRRGLDRLLLGYALGSAPAGPVQAPLPCDLAEGDGAVLLGRLAGFVDRLAEVSELGSSPRAAADWAAALDRLLDVFFVSTNETYREVAALRGAVAALGRTAGSAGFEGRLPLAVVRDFLSERLQQAAGGEALVGNAVVVSALRAGSSAPRRVMCLLGMGDGLFPRSDNRAAYDLLRLKRRVGDRALRLEDRQAWLEALLSARETLYISHAGFNADDPAVVPASVLVDELREQAALMPGAGAILEVRHKLQAFDPAYFSPGPGPFFSYSTADYEAALRLRVPPGALPAEAGAETVSAAGEPARALALEDLVRFFRNPAEWHFTNVLGADLRLEAEAALGDAEAFEPAGLEAYQVHQVLVGAWLDQAEPAAEARVREAARVRLLEDGLLPLEQGGREWFDERWANVGALLGARAAGLARLADALRSQRAAPRAVVSASVSLPGGGVTVSGSTAVWAGPGGSPVALDFRCARPRPATLLGSWLTHVAACASGLRETRFVIERKEADAKKGAWWAFALGPLEARAAAGLLARYVAEFRAGHDRVPPFTPGTAYGYAAAYRSLKPKKGEPPPTPAQRRAAGLAKARAAWASNDFSRGDDQDPFFRKAFGPDGPFRDEAQFCGLADRLVGPLLDQAAELELEGLGGAAGGDAGPAAGGGA